MKLLGRSYRMLYSALAQRKLDARFSTEFSVEGRFVSMENRGRHYVGPIENAEITARVEHFADLKADHRARRKLVSPMVREAYLPRPDPLAGAIVPALASAGFFRLRRVLVGTVVFQCYATLLVVRLPNTALPTGDADFAQFHPISVAVEYATLEWVDWSNHRRLLEPIGNIPPPKPDNNIMLPRTTSIWQRDSHLMPSGEVGAV